MKMDELTGVQRAMVAQIAAVCHEANRRLCMALGDYSQKEWEFAPIWQRHSSYVGVLAVIVNPGQTPEQSHELWMAHKLAEGWKYGPVKDEATKLHPCLVPYADLSVDERVKDALFTGIVRAMLPLAAEVFPELLGEAAERKAEKKEEGEENRIQWYRSSDERGECWMGSSPYAEEKDGPCFQWRIRRDGKRGVWVEDHDEELCPDRSVVWPNLADAQRHCQEMHDEIIREEMDRRG